MEPEIVSEMPVSICHTVTHFVPPYSQFMDLLKVFEVLWASVIIRPLARSSDVPRNFFRGGGVQQIQLRTKDRMEIWGR